MKIGIITFHRAINYGAILQTYALQKMLQQKGYDVEVIDYRCQHMENMYRLIGFKGKTIKQGIRDLLYIVGKYKKQNNFRKFVKTYVKLSDVVYTQENISTANEVYDKFITGSDQVFNYACSKFDKNYFLQFVNDKRKIYSYAASFSMKEIPTDKMLEYKKLLDRFREISVREATGQEIVKSLTNKESELSVDPVFLLEKNAWSKIAVKPKFDNYILIYKLNSSDLLYDFARKLAKITNKKIVALNFDVVEQMKERDILGLTTASIEEFIGLFQHADYVVTNSFHGTAFSIIFGKKFYVEALQKDFKPNDRVESLLALTKLEKSKIRTLDDCNLNIVRDYEYATKILEVEREKAVSYLERILANE